MDDIPFNQAACIGFRLTEKHHVAATGDPTIAIVHPVDGGVVLIVAAQRSQHQCIGGLLIALNGALAADNKVGFAARGVPLPA